MPWMNQSDHQPLIRTQKMRTIASFTLEIIFQFKFKFNKQTKNRRKINNKFNVIEEQLIIDT